MRNYKQGCRWKSGNFAGISRSNLQFCSFLKKTLIIANDHAAVQAFSLRKNHLTSNNVRLVVNARSILNSFLDPRLRFTFMKLQETNKSREWNLSLSIPLLMTEYWSLEVNQFKPNLFNHKQMVCRSSGIFIKSLTLGYDIIGLLHICSDCSRRIYCILNQSYLSVTK